MIRSIAIVTTGTLASRLTGFARDAMIAALLGAGAVADAFLIAFQLVTLIRRLLTEGALNAAFVPAWLKISRENGDAKAAAFAGRAVGTLGLAVAAVALLLAFAAPFAIALLAPGFDPATQRSAIDATRLMLPYLAFAGPVAVLIALANAQRHVVLSSAAPLLFNTTLIATCAALLWSAAEPTRAVWIIAATVGVAGLLQAAMLAGATRAASPLRIGLDGPTRTLLVRALPGMIAGAGPQLLIACAAIAASRTPAAVSWLYFASRLIDLPLGIVSSVSGAVLVTEAAHAADDPAAARTAQAHAIGAAMALAMPAAVGLFVLAEPIASLVFARGAFTAGDAQQTARVLQMLALGLPAQALVKALAPSFYARGDTLTPMLAIVGGSVATLAGAFFFEDVMGIAAAVALGGAISAAVLIACRAKLMTADMRLGRIALATATMGAVLALAGNAQPSSAGGLVISIAIGLVVYLAALWVCGAFTWHAMHAAWTRRGLRDGNARGTGTPSQPPQETDT